MSIEFDSNPKFADYSNPEVLVSSEWLSKNLRTKGLSWAEPAATKALGMKKVICLMTGGNKSRIKLWQLLQ